MKNIYVFAHTHWDREWYEPFETFRTYLLSVVRKLIEDLESGSLSKFYLDGQAVILDDVFELSPELAPRVSSLMEKGELSAGPWYVLADEMLVCGESLVRNLLLGIRTVSKYGKPALTGYSPDTFGHSQDLPAILASAGIESAFVWRGVPPLDGNPAFYWESPDGKKIIAYHLRRGYYQTTFHELSTEEDGAVKLADYFLPLLDTKLADGTLGIYDSLIGGALYPAGADHAAPPERYVETIEKVNSEFAKRKQEVQVQSVHLHEFAAQLQAAIANTDNNLVKISRELRDNRASLQYCSAYLLPAVLSTRLYLKKLNRQLEKQLFRQLEPRLSSLHLRGMLQYPFAELNHALKLLLKNQPHDSICGCSSDPVHVQMVARHAEAEHVLLALRQKSDEIVSGLGAGSKLSPRDPELKYTDALIVNTGAFVRSAPVPVSFCVAPDQKLDFAGDFFQLAKRRFSDELFAGWGKIPYYKNVDLVEGWLWAEDVPAFGELKLSLFKHKKSSTSPIKARGNTLDNGLLRVSVDATGDLVVMASLPGQKPKCHSLRHRFCDLGDGGDTYNFDPLSGDKPIYSKFKSVSIGRKGSLVSSLILKYEIDLPEGLIESGELTGKQSGIKDIKRSRKKLTHEIETELTLKRGSKVLFFETRWQNKSVGHRLEALLDCGQPVHTSFSENHFSLVQRFHQLKEKPVVLPVKKAEEAPCDRYPTQRFVIANGQVILNDGLPEYGVDGESISLTILRSVSLLSRGRMRSRGGGAGPHIDVPDAACLGANRVSYGWAPLMVADKKQLLFDVVNDQNRIEAYSLAEEFENEMRAVLTMNEALPEKSSLVQSENAALLPCGGYISDDGDAFIMRVLNVTDNAQKGKLYFGFDFHSVRFCNILEEEEEPIVYREFLTDGPENNPMPSSYISVELGKHELKTLKFRISSPPAKQRQPGKRSTKKKRTLA